MRFKFYKLAFAASALSFSNCGTESLPKALEDLEKLPPLVLANSQLLKQKLVLSGSYIVTFRGDESRPAYNSLFFANYASEFRTHHFYLASYSSDPRIENFRFLTSVDLAKPESTAAESLEFDPPEGLRLAWENKRQLRPIGLITRVDFKKPEDAQPVLVEWFRQGRIWFAEPNYTSELSQSSDWTVHKDNYEAAIEQNSSFYWASKINLTKSFEALADIKDSYDDQPIVAVMDSGVDTEHSSLKERIWSNDNGLGTGGCGGSDVNGCNTSETKEKGVLGDGDVSPFSAGGMGKVCPTTGGQCKKNCCHGTHVAGIIAADITKNNQAAGICPICRIMVLRVVGKAKDNPDGTILDSSIISALKYVTHFRTNNTLAVRVINASFGKFQRSRAVSLLVRTIKDTPRSDKGSIIVGAAGNEDTNKMQYPAAFKDAIAVANIHRSGPKHESSNFGRWVDISAPGTDIYSTVPGNGFEPKSGTSMAAPVVAGIAGLLIAARPNASVAAIRKDLLNGADPGLYDDAVNDAYLVRLEGENSSMPLLGTGMVDAFNSVKQIQTKNRPALSSLDRVDESCGVIRMDRTEQSSYLVFFLIPLLLLVLFGMWKTRRNHQSG